MGATVGGFPPELQHPIGVLVSGGAGLAEALNADCLSPGYEGEMSWQNAENLLASSLGGGLVCSTKASMIAER
jgi:hypothetical protein